MPSRSLTLFAASLVAWALVSPRSVPAGGQEARADAKASKAGTPIQLFNGKDFTGFYSWLGSRGRNTDPKQVFTVSDGILRISGEELGTLTTEADYSNYHLVVEWRWGTKTFAPRIDRARDSGILVHSVGEPVMGQNWLPSIENQVIEGGCGDFIIIPGKEGKFEMTRGKETKKSGRFDWYHRDPAWKDSLGFRGARDPDKPVGEWNRQESICIADTIVNIMNGVVVNHGTQVSPTRGKIQIQSEGAEMFVRKIELTPLE